MPVGFCSNLLNLSNLFPGVLQGFRWSESNAHLAWMAKIEHEFTELLSSNTVHAPHSPFLHPPNLAPKNWCLRKKVKRDSLRVTSSDISMPLIFKVIFICFYLLLFNNRWDNVFISEARKEADAH